MDAMDLFPDGGFVRLRSRGRDKYIHADADDEDETSVSLRPLGDVPSLTTVWKVDLRPVEGGDSFLLLQGAAYGRYLAVAPADDFPPPGHRSVRAVQRDYNSMGRLDPSFAWTPYRVEAGENCVRLHIGDEQRCLRANGRHPSRANGRHRSKNNLVTVDDWSGDETTMMQWTVEAIPSTPEPLPLPPPRPGCCGCGRDSSTPLCCLCAARMKSKLRDAAKSLLKIECAQKYSYYCLKCRQMFTATHIEHRDKTIPVGRYKNRPVAWVTGEESWSRIFESIEAPDRGIKPYQLFESKDPRCNTCGDIVSEDSDGFCGTLIEFCTLQCFVAGRSEEMAVEKALATMNYSDSPIGFCLSCATPVRSGGANTHAGHDWVRVHADSVGLWVILPQGHPKEQTWASVKKKGTSNKFLVRADSSLRCKKCHKRLASTGDSCSLGCWLDAPWLPRALQPSKTKNA